jgi:glucose dehydrogenase
MPNVSIAGQGTHNVVYVETQADTVYAVDADSGAQLWSASMLNGSTVANGTFLA